MKALIDNSKCIDYWDYFNDELYTNIKKMNCNTKISADAAEAVYSILVRVLDIRDDFYERESFIYHHHMVDHDISEYEVSSRTGLVYKFTISNTDDRIKLHLNDSAVNDDDMLHINDNIKKANKIINWKLKKHAYISTLI